MRHLPIEVIAARQAYRCFYCQHLMIRHRHEDGKPTPRNAMTKDHITPRVYGGPTTHENLLAACAQCNHLRGEVEAVAFANLIKKWFQRDETLFERWHTLERTELEGFKVATLTTYERQLRGKARSVIEYGFRHFEFIFRERRRLQRA